MEALRWVAPAISVLAAALSVAAWVKSSRGREAGPAAAAPPPAAGAPSGPSAEAELAALRNEVARLRDAVRSLPAGGTEGVTLEQLRREILAVERERALAARAAEARTLAARASEQSRRWVDSLAGELGLDAAQRATVQDLVDAHVAGYEAAWSLLPGDAPPEPDPETGAPRPAAQVRMGRLDRETWSAIREALPPTQREAWGKKPRKWFDGMATAPAGERK